jgi:hypothetical protein
LGRGRIRTVADWNTLRDCLRSKPTLWNLKFYLVRFSAEKMQVLLNCLARRETEDDWSPGITKLSLDDCDLDDESTALLTEFMHTEVDGNDSPAVFCPLREFCLVYTTGPCTGWLTSSLLVSMLLPSDGRQTIGSRLSSLAVDLAILDDGFLEALSNNAHAIQLDTLRVIDLHVDDCIALKQCVLQLPFLRHLRIARVDEPSESSRVILHMLRLCHTLHTFVVEEHHCDEETGLLFDNIASRFAEACCERNRRLGPLLEQDYGSGQPIPSDRAGQALYPTLLQAVKQTPKSWLLTFSSSFENLGDCIGPEATV